MTVKELVEHLVSRYNPDSAVKFVVYDDDSNQSTLELNESYDLNGVTIIEIG